MKPPPLKDNCFAMPPGVEWTPVQEALQRLQAALHCVVGHARVDVMAAGGRILAQDVHARADHPPFANSAVDGFGFAASALAQQGEVITLPLAPGRAAAGAPFQGKVPQGHAIRILTGARLPEGVDTVVLEEDCSATTDKIAFRKGLRGGANTRPQGEDIRKEQPLFTAGHRLSAADLGVLRAGGHNLIEVFEPLCVGVLSTGDEVSSEATLDGKIPDANRPMLLEMLRKFGVAAVDLGHVPDDRNLLRDCLNKARSEVHAVLTTGGASAGDEDHVSALLRDEGQLASWRIALKPGRPLALATWKGMAVFGLPGNPVAAFVCTAIFARPALQFMAGGEWQNPIGYDLPAGFAKSKKPGRREYLRARIAKGHVQVFASEGSGRISGLSWADGLVELDDKAREIKPGDLVRFIPFSAFGL